MDPLLFATLAKGCCAHGCLSSVGRREFPVSGATFWIGLRMVNGEWKRLRSRMGMWMLLVMMVMAWNDLPLHVASAPSLAVFRQRLETFLFSRSYQDTIM